jgi:hypothetical protein
VTGVDELFFVWQRTINFSLCICFQILDDNTFKNYKHHVFFLQVLRAGLKTLILGRKINDDIQRHQEARGKRNKLNGRWTNMF